MNGLGIRSAETFLVSLKWGKKMLYSTLQRLHLQKLMALLLWPRLFPCHHPKLPTLLRPSNLAGSYFQAYNLYHPPIHPLRFDYQSFLLDLFLLSIELIFGHTPRIPLHLILTLSDNHSSKFHAKHMIKCYSYWGVKLHFLWDHRFEINTQLCTSKEDKILTVRN